MPNHPKSIPIQVPMPIWTPRLVIRPRQAGDECATVAAVAETWHDLHQWMAWAETLADNTIEKQEIRTRHHRMRFERREELNLLGIETATSEPVVWCGLHEIDWTTRRCDTGFWVRKHAQNRGFATEACNALVRYAFGVLHMRRVGITHSDGNEASRRVVEKLGFTPEGVQCGVNALPGGRFADRFRYARLGLEGLPPLDVSWDE